MAWRRVGVRDSDRDRDSDRGRDRDRGRDSGLEEGGDGGVGEGRALVGHGELAQRGVALEARGDRDQPLLREAVALERDGEQ
jgi:hypothetical protein